MLRLRPYKKCDAKYIVSWIKDEITFKKWSANKINKYPITADELNAHYAKQDENDAFFVMSAYDETGVVGQMLMRFLDEKKKILRFGFIIVDDSKRGKGYGKGMLQLAIKYATDILKVEKITIGVFDNNMPAYNCYRSLGFVEMPEKAEIYRIGDEDWKCLEMEMDVCQVYS